MRYVAFCFLIFYLSPVIANTLYPFATDKQTQQFDSLVKEVRCLVCQNQNIADSHAPLAQDLREKIYSLVQSGETSEAIRTYLTTRYGDFILFNPPFKSLTWVLWVSPFACLALLFFLLIRQSKRNNPC